jgi:hypothetical protein
MGHMISCEKLIPAARINYRSFQRQVILELRSGRAPRFVSLGDRAIADLYWWASVGNLQRSVPFRPPPHDVIIQTDASNEGWGAFTEAWHLSGRWTGAEALLHTNHKELLVVLKVLLAKSQVLRGLVLMFLVDNTTAVAYLMKQGGTRSARMTETVRAILGLADRSSITVHAKHLRGSLNALADMLSRPDEVLKTEWRLSDDNFLWICEQSPWGAPTIDLFANRFNKQLDRYMSPCPDEEAVAVDALIQRWPQEVLYAFPPTTIMEQVVGKVHQERPQRLLLVAPDWPSSAWSRTLTTLADRWRPIPYLKLLQPLSRSEHPSPLSSCLALWLISYRDSLTEVILRGFLVSCTGLAWARLTRFMLRNGACLKLTARMWVLTRFKPLRRTLLIFWQRLRPNGP